MLHIYIYIYIYDISSLRVKVTRYVTRKNRALCAKLTIRNGLNIMTLILWKLIFHTFRVFVALNHKNLFSFCQFYYIKISHILILFSNLRVDLPVSLCPSGIPTQNTYVRFSSPMRATCPAIFSFRQRLIAAMFDEKFQS